MPERADYIPPLTKWDCLQPDPNEGIVCKRCGGDGSIDVTRDAGGSPVKQCVPCPDCHGTGRP